MLNVGIHVRVDGEVRIAGMDQLLALARRFLPEEQPHITGGRIVYIVKDSQAPVPFQVTGVTATDAKGQPVADAQLKYVMESTDPSVVSVTQDGTDPTKGVAAFGNEGPATINVTVEDAAGNTLGAFASNFTVTAGDPTAISGGSIVFQGLTEAPVADPTAATTPAATADPSATPVATS